MAYVTQQEFNIALQDIEKIKLKISNLEEKKADADVLQGIKNDIKLLNNSIDSMKSDRTEDKEIIKELREEVKQLSDAINSNNIVNAEIKASQQNNKEQLQELRNDMHALVTQVAGMKESIDNSFWNTFCRVYTKYSLIKIITWILIFVFITLLISAFFFYTSNAEYANRFKNIYYFLRGVFK